MTDFYFSKTADEDKDYTLDWSKDLGTDTIASSTWAVESDRSRSSPAPPRAKLTPPLLWDGISGGTPGQNYLLVNTITTVGEREMEQRLVISIDAPGT